MVRAVNGLEQDRRLLEWLCEWADMSASRLGEEAGLSPTTITRPLSAAGASRLSANTRDKLRARFPDFPGWDQTSEGRPLAPLSAAVAPSHDLVQIDKINMAYGLGGTFIDNEAIEAEKVTFSRSWLRAFTHSAPELLFTTDGSGDSMEPTISDHDIVICDRGQVRLDQVKSDKLWACIFGGVGMIKRLRPMPDGRVRIMSDNQLVRDDYAGDGDLHIVGRVVAVVKRH